MLIKNVESLQMQPAGHSQGIEPVLFGEAFTNQDFVGEWGFVEYVTVPTGSAIPVHRHSQDEELYVVFQGQGILTLDNQEVEVGPGDLAACRKGSSHGLRNTSDEEIRLLVVGIPA
ncbi:MAG: cupin domain-containing protein [Anaerolineae bacterium]|jgi:quercetin dioxygenase-like cupin family protein